MKRGAFAFALIILTLTLIGVKGPVTGQFWSLLPPLLAIAAALLTGRLLLSLGFAVWYGAFLLSFGETLSVFKGAWGSLEFTAKAAASGVSHADNLYILGFVIVVLSVVQLLSQNGSLKGLVHSLEKRVRGPRSAQLVTALLGCLIFIDDYANTMVVGSTMKSVTDRYGISREKLAFLVDATSAPIAGVALVSTWVGFEVGLFNEMSVQHGWGLDGYTVFLQGLGFRFYCWFMLLFVFVQIYFSVDYGPMRAIEEKARQSTPVKPVATSKSLGPWAALAPLAFLFFSVFALLWWDGGGWSQAYAFYSPSSWRQVLTQSENGIAMLFYAALISGLFTIFLSLFFLKMTLRDLFKILLSGLRGAVLPVVILLLAWSLKSVTDSLQTGEYIVASVSGGLSPLWLPLIIFLVSMFSAFSTGTSWGTMAILIPTLTPLVLSLGEGEYSIYVALCLAAILDGAIMGDHCSPISDTTLMSAIATECDVLSHVRTQWPYSLTVGLLAVFLGYFPVGRLVAAEALPPGFLGLSLMVAFILLVILFFVLKRAQLSQGDLS